MPSIPSCEVSQNWIGNTLSNTSARIAVSGFAPAS